MDKQHIARSDRGKEAAAAEVVQAVCAPARQEAAVSALKAVRPQKGRMILHPCQGGPGQICHGGIHPHPISLHAPDRGEEQSAGSGQEAAQLGMDSDLVQSTGSQMFLIGPLNCLSLLLQIQGIGFLPVPEQAPAQVAPGHGKPGRLLHRFR